MLGGKAVIDWLNGRAIAYDDNGNPVKATWTTGRTGMIGHSYEGSLAIGLAGTGVRGLETIVPLAVPSSWYDMRQNRSLRDIAARLVITKGKKKGRQPSPATVLRMLREHDGAAAVPTTVG